MRVSVEKVESGKKARPARQILRISDFGFRIFHFAAGFASFARCTPTVFRGPFRVRALVLVRWPRTGRPRR